MQITSQRGRARKAFVLLVLLALSLATGTTVFAQDDSGDGVDHSAFPQLEGPFASAPEVTAACLTCHAETGEEVMGTTHWTWEYESAATGETLGKRNVINNYCVSVTPNEPRCTSCHVGYGWTDDSFDFSDANNIDCLVCHESTGTYKKFPTAAGHPVYEPTQFGGKDWAPPDLAAVAQSVGSPSRANCGACHFTGGGGADVKHGDLDTTLVTPGFELDVHMDAEGLNFSCQTCHVTEKHEIAGSRYEADATSATTCQSCHEAAPHAEEALNTHTARVACQTCHVPEFARVNPTMMTWDWTVAGERNDDNSIKIVSDEATGKHTYDSRKGAFTWEANVVPEYRWFDGSFDYSLFEEGVDPEVGFIINEVQGSRENPDARIWPFKQFTGLQPYDAGNNVIAPLNLFPKPDDADTAFWKNWDLELAVEGGLAAWGQEYSGEMGFIESEMYWPLTHMVAPAEQALECTACHAEDGRIDFASLGYSDEEVARLTTFPPAEEEMEEVAEEAPAAEEEEAAPAEEAEPAAEAEAEAVESTTSAAPSPVIYVVAVVVVVAIVAGVVISQRRKE
jgi:octaheme c-type cytochrome (tetrathionate reductase family)